MSNGLTRKEIRVPFRRYRDICMCQFFSIEVAAIYGRPPRVYPGKRPLLERTHTCREAWCQKCVKNSPCRTTFLRLCGIFSEAVFSPRGPMMVSQKRQKLRSKKVST